MVNGSVRDLCSGQALLEHHGRSVSFRPCCAYLQDDQRRQLPTPITNRDWDQISVQRCT